MNVRISTINKKNKIEENKLDENTLEVGMSDLELTWQVLSVIFYLFFWTYYTYWDELKKKVQFVTQYRNAKELQKLKSIINILIPNLVRSRLTDGKKNFAETQGEVTIIFIDLDKRLSLWDSPRSISSQTLSFLTQNDFGCCLVELRPNIWS